MSIKLCPFCEKLPGTKVGPPAMARCITNGCEGTKLAAVTLVAWNGREDAASDADVRKVALAICKSRTCEGVSCCQWPANMGRKNCNAKNGAYDDAARAAIAAMSRLPQENASE